MRQREIPGLDAIMRREVYAHAFGAIDREVGGVLIGTASPGSPPRVEGSIPALQASESAAQLTFTQDAWAHIHRVLEEEHPGLQIVGWYHTHPGYGLFLSEQDLFIHRNFFQNPRQIAVVIDPLAEEEAVFAWTGGEIREYYRHKTAYRAPSRIDRGPRAPAADGSTGGLLRVQARGGSHPETGSPTEFAHRSPLVTYIYLAVIGVSAGTVFWELVLR